VRFATGRSMGRHEKTANCDLASLNGASSIEPITIVRLSLSTSYALNAAEALVVLPLDRHQMSKSTSAAPSSSSSAATSAVVGRPETPGSTSSSATVSASRSADGPGGFGGGGSYR
jgi:hypothetical protein